MELWERVTEKVPSTSRSQLRVVMGDIVGVGLQRQVPRFRRDLR